jgi:hypothetical protein
MKKVKDNINWDKPEEYEELGINFIHVGKPRGTYSFTGKDEQLQYSKTLSMIEIPRDWRYRNEDISYTFNSEGFRNDFEFADVDWSKAVGVLGCSHIFGKGINQQFTIPNHIGNELKLRSVNLGSEGASIRTVFNNAIHLMDRYYPKAIAVLWPSINRVSLAYKWDTVENGWSSIDMSGTEKEVSLFRPKEPDQYGLIANEQIQLKYKDLWPRIDESHFLENQDMVYQLNLYRQTLKLIARDRNISYYDFSLTRTNKPGMNALDKVKAPYPEIMRTNFNYIGDYENSKPGWINMPDEHKIWWLNNVCARDITKFDRSHGNGPGGSHFGPVLNKAIAKLILENKLV